MVAAYRRTTECMPDNGIQVIMFTHQSGTIWADMANIVWASGLQVTAAWYVVTETDSALREGSYVKGTVLLVVRKRGARRRPLATTWRGKSKRKSKRRCTRSPASTNRPKGSTAMKTSSRMPTFKWPVTLPRCVSSRNTR